MKNAYLGAMVVTCMLLVFFAMSFGLEYVFDEHVAELLAATGTWSVLVFLCTLDGIRLPYRQAFFGGSCYGLFMMVFTLAPLIVGAKPHVFRLIAVVVLIPPMLAISALLQRILFTDEERLELKSRTSQRTRVV